MAKTGTSTITWKEFEEFVARLERTLSDPNSVVKFDDRVRDKYGKPRQVDATLRMKTGTTEVLIIIECRKRKGASDVRWVEEVNTKKSNLRANHAILVTNQRLGPNCYEMAADLGIELRTLSELEPKDMPWMFPNRIVDGSRLRDEVVSVTIHPNGQGLTQQDLEALRRAIDAEEPITLWVAGQGYRQLDSLAREALKRFSPAPLSLGVKSQTYDFDLVPSGRAATVTFGEKTFPVSTVILQLCHRELDGPPDTFFGEYSGTSDSLDHFVARCSSMTAVARRGQDGFFINVPADQFDENIRDRIDPIRGATIEVFQGPDGLPAIRRVS